ncbi:MULTISPECIES: hypothetical protein [Nocardiaceae]|uniref:Peptidoglycan/LPS O-acetylase OafA/YrhL n=1 Tax=Rhodococcoides corynebacterioides TaxID=53972 RepID=A0ABS2KYK7_9NOCA|nr:MULTISPECIES: hypothetical protein [Rhodococcus]MBM7417017.1 peptidoglycan/LPS O-acetylase OafA/YrhL [Rhodococcus corynebacterioides]MBP1115270.1 peptidoglycan/LPS O-acetylase OafA/YrhL [Rhodococcus sp. PvP016]
MSYHNDLAHHLRRRGCTEVAVVEVLHTVDDAVSATHSAPEAEFGPAEAYAAQFSGPRRTTPGQAALRVCGALGLVAIALFIVVPRLSGITLPLPGPVLGVITMLALILIGCVIGSARDNALPRGYIERRQGNLPGE